MDVLIQVLVLMWVVLFVVTLQWARVRSRGASVATWLGFTLVSWWVEIAVAFFVVHATLFSFGRDVALVVGIGMVAIFTLTPAAWAYGLSRWNRNHA